MLPSFLIIGSLKSGSTSFFEYLAQHPEIYTSPIKEPRFFLYEGASRERLRLAESFAAPPVTSRERYEALFAGAESFTVAGEASASYLYDTAAADRIRTLVPEMKLIALLRDPVARAYSSYLHLRRVGAEEHEDFGAALAAEPERVAQGWPAIYHYVRAGLYAEHLEAYLRRFPREQLLVLFYDDLVRDPKQLLRRTFRFLGVDEAFEGDVNTVYNRGGVVRSAIMDRLLNNPPPAVRRLARFVVPPTRRRALYRGLHDRNLERPPPLPADVSAGLREYFEEDLQALEALTGRALPGWRSAAAT